MMVGRADVVGFGPDGIVVGGDGAPRPPLDERERAAGGGDPDGRLVLDERGDAAGALTDVVFDEAPGALDALVCGAREIPAERPSLIGPYCVPVRAEQPWRSNLAAMATAPPCTHPDRAAAGRPPEEGPGCEDRRRTGSDDRSRCGAHRAGPVRGRPAAATRIPAPPPHR